MPIITTDMRGFCDIVTRHTMMVDVNIVTFSARAGSTNRIEFVWMRTLLPKSAML